MTTRASVVVRRADEGDLTLLAELFDAAAGAEGARVPRPAATGSARLARLLTRADVEVHVAFSAAPEDPEPVGVLVLRVSDVVLPVPAPALSVELLWVDPAWRRRGVGHQLLSVVVAVADATSAEEVSVRADPGERDVQRFLARLGFARPVVLRTAPLAVLRARLAPPAAPAGVRDRRRAALDQLLARRRRQLAVGSEGSRAMSTKIRSGERPAAGR